MGFHGGGTGPWTDSGGELTPAVDPVDLLVHALGTVMLDADGDAGITSGGDLTLSGDTALLEADGPLQNATVHSTSGDVAMSQTSGGSFTIKAGGDAVFFIPNGSIRCDTSPPTVDWIRWVSQNGVVLSAPAAEPFPAGALNDASQYIGWVDEGTDELVFMVRYSDGATVKSGRVALT